MKNWNLTIETPFKRLSICLFLGLLLAFGDVLYAQQDDVSQDTARTYENSIESEKEEMSDYLEAVQLAQDGDLTSALDLIQKARKEFPDEPKIIVDHIVILAWMEKYDEAVEMYDKNKSLKLPDYAAREVIRSLREIGRHEDSIRLSELYLNTDPEEMDIITGMIYSLIYTENYEKASDQLTMVRTKKIDEPWSSSLQVYLYASQKQWDNFFNSVKAMKTKKIKEQDSAVLSVRNEGFYLAYEESIRLARQEQYDQALNYMDLLKAGGYQSNKMEMDRIVIDVWREDFNGAMAKYKKMSIKEALPPYFLKEVAYAYTEKSKEVDISGKHWENIAPYVKSIEVDEEKRQAKLTLIRSYMEDGNLDEALNAVNEMLANDPEGIDALFLKAEIYDFNEEYWMAIQVYNQILKSYPDNTSAFNLKLRTLMDIGATSLVLEQSKLHPDLVDPTIVERAKTDIPMHQIQWEEPKKALNEIDVLEKEYLHYLSDDKPNKDFVENYWRIKWDRLLALRQEEKMKVIIDEYETLTEKGTTIPPWIKRATADAYLYEQQPEKALAIYEELIKKDQSFDLQMSRYYALIDLGRYLEAHDLLFMLDKKTPAKIIERGILQDNFKKADIAFNKAWLLMYQDRLAEAEKYIQKVKNVSPSSVHLRTAEAHNHSYRGWRRQALEDFKILRTLDDRFTSAHIGYANALNKNMQKQKARDEIIRVLLKKPTNRHAKRLKREFDVEEMTTVTLDAIYRTESEGEDEYKVSLRGDQPIGFQHTLFAEIVRREETQEGGNQVTRKIYLGDQWQIDNTWRLVGAITGDYEGKGVVGYVGEVRMQPDDYWTFDFAYESNTLNVSSRSRQSGVEADQYTLSVAFRMSELFDTNFGITYKDFSDENTYLNYLWRTNTALITTAYWKMRLGTEFSHETFSKQDVDYFSPEKSYSFYLIPMVEHTWFRRYERSWVDRLYVGIGQRWQENFGSNNAGYIRYEQDHQFSDTKSLLIGTSYDLNYYDSDDVNALQVYSTARIKF